MFLEKGNVLQLYLGVKDSIEKQYEKGMYVVYDDTYVVCGNHEKPNYDYIQEHNIKIFDIATEGGTIVVSSGDIGFGLVAHYQSDKTNKYLKFAKEKYLDFFTKKGLNVSVENNDVLVDSTYKVASYSSHRYGDYVFGVFQLSVNVNLDLIHHICQKEMIKIPKGLSEYGVTTEELLDVLFEIDNEYQNKEGAEV